MLIGPNGKFKQKCQYIILKGMIELICEPTGNGMINVELYVLLCFYAIFTSSFIIKKNVKSFLPRFCSMDGFNILLRPGLYFPFPTSDLVTKSFVLLCLIPWSPYLRVATCPGFSPTVRVLKPMSKLQLA